MKYDIKKRRCRCAGQASDHIGMACITCIPGRLRNVNCGIDRYHTGILPLVAGTACSRCNPYMAEGRPQERRAKPGSATARISGRVTRNAIRRGRNVTRILAQRSGSVMTRAACWRSRSCRRERGICRYACWARVVVLHAIKRQAVRASRSGIGVASNTIPRSRNMRHFLACRGGTIVAGTACRRCRRSRWERGISSRRVRKTGAQECRISCGIRLGVACRTIRRCRHMPQVLGQRACSHIAPVMAGRARPGGRVS